MSTVKLVDEATASPRVRAVFEDIKATKKTDRVSNIWRALANHPEHLELCWSRLKAIMRPGTVDALTKEIIALAVSTTNSCRYCINSHTAAVQKLGLDREQLGEVLAVVGLFNQMNKLADGFQIEPDVLPNLDAWSPPRLSIPLLYLRAAERLLAEFVEPLLEETPAALGGVDAVELVDGPVRDGGSWNAVGALVAVAA